MPVQIGQSSDHGFDQPLGLLMDCHRRIERFLEAMRDVAHRQRGGPLDARDREALIKAVRYFRNAAPWHTADEEESLFPRLRQIESSAVQSLWEEIEALEDDHRAAQDAHEAANALVDCWLEEGALSQEQTQRLIHLLDGLRRRYEQHIRLEDEVVFPLARRLLNDQQLQAVGQEMATRRGVDPSQPTPRCKHARRTKPDSSTRSSDTPAQAPAGDADPGVPTMSATPTIQTTVGELVTQRPSRSRLFERLGLDYCCGGKRTLQEACEAKGLDAHTVLSLLLADEESQSAAQNDQQDWSQASLTDLADHIEQTHHAYLKRELPRLGEMVRKVAAVHGQLHPWLLELDGIFARFAAEMESHMLKEEQILFPLIRQLEAQQSAAGGQGMLDLTNPVRVMEHEHDDAGRDLARMRELSSDFTPPPEACGTFRATLDGLRQLEADTHQHVHKENNILFPRAIEQQRSIGSGAGR
ncbi:MAG TPA: iron-sulfur cluster repair di-iron protein [Phycisphaeraceae bacterium]